MISLILCGLVLLRCGLSLALQAERGSIARLPLLQMWSGAPRVCLLAGKMTANFLLDTGSTHNVLSARVADELGLKRQPARSLDGNSVRLNGEEAEMVVLPSLSAGQTAFKGVPFIVLPERELRAIGKGDVIDGILGLNLFRYAPIMLDLSRNEAWLCYGDPFSNDYRQEILRDGFTEIDVAQQAESHRYAIRFQMGDITATLDLDTGSPWTVLPADLASRMGLGSKKKKVDYETIHGKFKLNTAVIPEVKLAGSIVSKVKVLYPDRPEPGLNYHLGLDVLSRFQLWLDFPHNRMFIRPVRPG